MEGTVHIVQVRHGARRWMHEDLGRRLLEKGRIPSSSDFLASIQLCSYPERIAS